MGVKNLWSLLEPTGRRVNIESLGGKRVAVDASIWLVQFIKAMRDERGDMLHNAHLMGFFRRICRLLYHRISPIFVFDGSTPALKRRTTAARRRVRENKQGQVRRTAEKLLLNALKQSALNEALRAKGAGGSEPGGSGPSAGAGAKDGGNGNVSVDLTNEKDDANAKANAVVLLDDVPEWDASETSEEESESEEEEEEDMFIPDADDIDPTVLASLPPSVQMEVMLKMRERRVVENREHFQRLSGDMTGFAEMQMATYLKSTQLKRTMERVIKDGGGGTVKAEGSALVGGGDALALTNRDGAGPSRLDPNALAGKRIASNNNREFVFSKPVVGAFGGGFESGTTTEGWAGDDRKPGADAFAKSLFGPPRERFASGLFGFGLGRGRGRGRGRGGRGFQSGPLIAPQERFLLSSVNKALPTPTVTHAIAESPVLPYDQRAGNDGKETLDLQITFHGSDITGEDPLFADCGDPVPCEELVVNSHDVLKIEKVAEIAEVEEEEEEEWEDVLPDERETNEEEADVDGDGGGAGGSRITAPKRAAFWSLNHGFAKGRSLGQWDLEEAEEEAAAGGTSRDAVAVDDDGLEAALNADNAVPRDRKGKAPIDSGPKSSGYPIDADEKPSVVDSRHVAEMDVEDRDVEDGDVEDGDLQATIAASLALAPRIGGNAPSRVSDDDDEKEVVGLDAGWETRGDDVVHAVEDDVVDAATTLEDDEEEEEEPPSQGAARAAARRASFGKPADVVDAPGPSQPANPNFDDGDDDALLAAVTAAETAVETAAETAAAEAAQRLRLEEMLGETAVERGALRWEARQAATGADAPTEDMYGQIQDLLTLFGIPYVIAPQEAEAQCSWMNEHGLVDAVVTDDSDAFLFGATHVYRNVFESKKYVEAYSTDRIEKELGLDREKMAHLALLLGSDYTEGVQGVGIVNALEIVTAFQGLDGLTEFKQWCGKSEFTGSVPAALRNKANALPAPPPGKKGDGKKGDDKNADGEDDGEDEVVIVDEANGTEGGVLTSQKSDRDPNPLRESFFNQHRSVKKGWDLPNGFPSLAVLQAYKTPVVDSSKEKLSWGRPDLQALRVFCGESFDWPQQRTDELLVPVLKLWEKADHQSRIDRFFHAQSAPHEFNERFAKYRSTRIRTAVAGLTGHAIDPELALDAAPAELAGVVDAANQKGKTKPKAKPKAKPKPKPKLKRAAGSEPSNEPSSQAGDALVPKPRAKKRLGGGE